MSELLLELFSEEIPALMQKNAAEAYKTIFTTILQENELVGDVQVFIGPRRIAVYITNLPKSIPPKEIIIRGPKVSSTSQAIEGFCRSNNIEQKKLSTLLVQGQSYYIIVKNTEETDIRVLLEDMIPKAISKYIWPKSMYWGNYDISWIRPLKNILCIFDGEILAIKYGHLTANNITFGHRFISPESITIDSFSEYQTKLRESNVIIDQDGRKEIIKSQLLIIAKSLNLEIKEDEKLLQEVTGLVELPVVMLGKIPSHFLKLPSEVLVSSMRNHQKYFSTFDETGNFAPYFLFVSNMPHDKDIIVAGNEKVLSARLSDALYFYQQDLSSSLQSKLPKLERITFHAKLGSVKQKTERVADICNYIIPRNQNLQIAARLCKSDLTSEMVGEFPELQGIMGYYYAKEDQLGEEIAAAIRDHYKPQGPSDSLPVGDAAILAIADKLDSLVGLILIGEEPSGSRDPYSLRRQALGIIRIILGNRLSINIKQLVTYVVHLYQTMFEDIISYRHSLASTSDPCKNKDLDSCLRRNDSEGSRDDSEGSGNDSETNGNDITSSNDIKGNGNNIYDGMLSFLRSQESKEVDRKGASDILDTCLRRDDIKGNRDDGIDCTQTHQWTLSIYDIKGGGNDSELNKTRQIILDFLEERAKYYFKNHYDISLINAVLDFDIEEDLVVSEMKLASLQEFLTKADGKNLLTIYKRANNILEGSNIKGKVNQDAFISKYEQELFLSLGVISKQIDSYIVEKDFTKTLSLLLEILKPVNEFFDNVMVKDQDHNIANNRLLLLRMVMRLFDKLAKFSFL